MRFDYCAYSHVGLRENNEDSYGFTPDEETFAAVVADGVGGYALGEVASGTAVSSILEQLKPLTPNEDLLLDAINTAGFQITQAFPHGYTTVTALWLTADSAIAAHVGDSRIYQFRDGRIIFQTQDHSEVMMAVLMGELPPDAPRTHPARNRIFRALGLPDPQGTKIDSRILDVRPGDRFLLCSDGFWEPVWEEDMLETMARTDSAQDWLYAMRALVDTAQDPNQDNHTAIAILVK